MFRQLQRLRLRDPTVAIPGLFHPLHLSALGDVRDDELGLVLCAPGEYEMTSSRDNLVKRLTRELLYQPLTKTKKKTRVVVPGLCL